MLLHTAFQIPDVRRQIPLLALHLRKDVIIPMTPGLILQKVLLRHITVAPGIFQVPPRVLNLGHVMVVIMVVTLQLILVFPFFDAELCLFGAVPSDEICVVVVGKGPFVLFKVFYPLLAAL